MGSRSRWIASGVERLFPGYFALVMATGIVSIATELLGMTGMAHALLWIGVLAYAALGALLLARVLFYFRKVIDDLRDHGRGAGFFTLVAGTCVLGSDFLVVGRERQVAMILWITGIVLWVLVMYAFFTAVVVREHKPSLEDGINGAWLLAIVSTQAVSTLGSLLAPAMAERELTLFFTLAMFLLGAMLYLTIITLIFYRFTFLEMPIERLTPPYWINMGAVAITTLAGSTLLLVRASSPLLRLLEPFLAGFTILFWAAATWWIPLLLILGVWRHVLRRFPLRYDPQYWGMVFPLGMYTVATFRLAHVLDIAPLRVVPRVFVFAAVAAWLLTFAGMLHSLVQAALHDGDSRQP